MHFEKQNDEVYYASGDLITLTRADLGAIADQAAKNPRKIARLCLHQSMTDPLHEMVIVNLRETYIRPHKNRGKQKSFLVLEGAMDVVVFADGGQITEVHRLGSFGSGRPHYFRLNHTRYHTLRVQSPVVLFQETTTGPFVPSDTEFAPWAPPPTQPDACATFIADMDRAILGYFP